MPFDIVSCQFAFHYACTSAAHAIAALQSIATTLAPRGVLCMTVPDADAVARLFVGVHRTSIANAVCRLDLMAPTTIADLREALLLLEAGRKEEEGGMSAPFWGVEYRFTLADSVDGVVEYMVPCAALARLAEEHTSLTHVETRPFASYEDSSNGIGCDGAMPESQREVCRLYKTLIFQKKQHQQPDTTPQQQQQNSTVMI